MSPITFSARSAATPATAVPYFAPCVLVCAQNSSNLHSVAVACLSCAIPASTPRRVSRVNLPSGPSFRGLSSFCCPPPRDLRRLWRSGSGHAHHGEPAGILFPQRFLCPLRSREPHASRSIRPCACRSIVCTQCAVAVSAASWPSKCDCGCIICPCKSVQNKATTDAACTGCGQARATHAMMRCTTHPWSMIPP